MGSVEEEIEYWTVQRRTLENRNTILLHTIESELEMVDALKTSIKEHRKQAQKNRERILVCDEHIESLGEDV